MAYATKVKLGRGAAVLFGAVLLVMTFFAGRASAVPQPNLEAALGHLEQAKTALQRAEHNKGGFRVKALGFVDQAITVVHQAISAGNK
jgi:hypothetical protein